MPQDRQKIIERRSESPKTWTKPPLFLPAPLKGLPSRWAARSGARVPPIVRPPPRTGIKLLDIAEQPATHAQIKKRRKLGE